MKGKLNEIALFEKIVEKYQRPMFLYACNLMHSDEEAEDVVQDIFLKLWNNMTFRDLQPDVLKTYLLRAVKNTCIDRLSASRMSLQRVDLAYLDILEEEASRLDEHLIQEVRKEMEALPEKTRKVLHAVYFMNLKYQDAAELLGVSVNTVKTLLKYGIKQLKEKLSDKFELFLFLHVSCD